MSELALKQPRLWALNTEQLIAGGIAVILLLQLHLIFVQGINWDEYYFLSQVHAAQTGSLQIALNTIHTRLFFWLPTLPDEITQIRVARLVMLGCEGVTVCSIIALARRFVDRDVALLAGLAYVSGGLVFQHGTSFRVDPIVTALLMASLYLSLNARRTIASAMMIALLVALAGLTTIKAIFYALPFLGIWLLRWHDADDRRATAIWMMTIVGLTGIFFISIYALHFAGLAQANIETSRNMINNAGEKMFSMGVFPRAIYIMKQAVMAPLLSLAVIAVPVAVLSQKRPNIEKFAISALWAPLLSLVIYRNSFAYYYVFVLAPVAVAAAIPLIPAVKRYGSIPLALFLLGGATITYWAMPKHMQQVQAQLLAQVKEIFPEPVAYIDFCSMIPSFPKQGFFMTGWGMDNYREAAVPIFASILAEQPVPLVIANHAALFNALDGTPSSDRLLANDAKLLRENYVHHWGPIWIAGKKIAAGDADVTIDIRVPGHYTVTGGAITIDGKAMTEGETIHLNRGLHILSGKRATSMELRYGKSIAKPSAPEPEPGVFGIFTDF